MKRSIFRAASVFFFLAVLVIYELPTAWASQIREIRIADSKGDWGYPNPYRHYPRGPGYIRMSWVFDTLIWKDQNGYIPALARSWQYDPHTMSFVFKLREGVTWHDGKPLSAKDVVFTVEYFKKYPYPWVPMEAIAGAELRGPYEAAIKLVKPYAPFLAYVGGTMPIIPKHVWEEVSDPQRYNDPEAFVGSGPFRFRDFDKVKGTYLYEANPDYYLGNAVVDRLIYIKAGSPIMALLSGKADLVNIRPDMAKSLRDKGMVVIESQRGWNKKLMINHKKPPFNDKRLRHALAYGINRQEIIEKSQRGFAAPASYGLLSIDHEMYNPETPTYPYDPEKARMLIESLGYRSGPEGFFVRDGRPLKVELFSSNITVAGESVVDRDGEVIKKQLESIGIQVDLVNMEQATTDSRVKRWKFDLAVSGHGGIYGDPRILKEMISSQCGAGSVNSARYDANAELNRLLEAQMLEMDQEKRKEIVFKIQELYAEDLPAISLYYPDSLAAYNPNKGIRWFYTKGGIALGIPIPQNKISLIK